MARHTNPRTRALSLEELEARLVNSATPVIQQSFDGTTAGSLPSGWTQWSSSGASTFGVSGARSVSGGFGLASTAASSVQGRAWLTTAQPAIVDATASIYVDSLIPAQILVRGRNLETASATYYAATVTRGLNIQLLKVLNGNATVLGEVKSASWLQDRWVQVTLSAAGESLKIQVYRTDTRQYLNTSGQWQTAQTWTLQRSDGAISGPGFAGLARAAQYSGTVPFDDFRVSGDDGLQAPPPSSTPPSGTTQQSFDGTATGSLPSGWAQWSSGSPSFAVSGARSLSGGFGLASTGSSTTNARTWLTVAQPADLQASVNLFADSLIPSGVLLRGRNLDSSSPSYYAAAVTRGLKVQLLKVVNGTTTVLGELNSASWLQDRWVQVTLSAVGESIKVQVYRADTRQYLNGSGQWQTDQAWALQRSDGAVAGSGLAGLARAAQFSGAAIFDDFAVSGASSGTPPAPAPVVPGRDTFDSATPGTLPSGWTQWASSGPATFAVTTTRSASGSASLGSTAASNVTGRAWQTATPPANVEVGTNVYLDSLIPAQIFLRGRSLDTTSPSYYAASVTRGLTLQLVKVVNGNSTVLGEVSSKSWIQGQWVQVKLSASGERIRAQVYRSDTRQYLTSTGNWQSSETWALDRSDGALANAGSVGLARPARYGGSVFLDDFTVTTLAATPAPVTPPPVTPPPTTPPPSTGLTIPRHYQHIRIAQLAYSGTPLGALEDRLLRESVDLVITDVPYLSEHIDKVAPATPQLSYTNYSSVYQDLLLDWLAYADRRGLSREEAFYHVRRATPFSGDSPSSQPVTWFWRVYRGGQSPSFRDFTTQAHIGGEDFAFGNFGESTYLAYPEKFRELNLSLARNAGPGWAAIVEYPTDVDSFGNPTAWAPIRATANSTAGLTRSGQILWDAPRDWKPASLNASPLFYYLRLRTISEGQPPVANTILGRDYVNAQGKPNGTIPAFDSAADSDGDGYLNDAEFARRSSGMDARFAYESRLFYGYYGQHRNATNPANRYFRDWSVDFAKRYLNSRPLSNGFFVDNSVGDPLVDAGTIKESLANYSENYGALLAEVGRAIAPRWILANTSGAGTKADAVVRQNPAYYEEFAIRPLSNHWLNFESLAGTIDHRAALQSPAPYAILDALPTGGSPTDPRTQIATLAYYYLIGDPERTFLNFYGGYEPASTWARHWSPATAFDVGRPTGKWSLFATGADPNDFRYSYRVYQRNYSNALVLYKPLSTNMGGGSAGSVSDNTVTTHALGGTYRPLRADGTLGAPITSVRLRNGEGAILVRA